MSFIRKRTKNLIMAGITGAIVMGIIAAAGGLFLYYKLIQTSNDLEKYRELVIEESSKVYSDIFILNRSLVAGELIEQDDIQQVSLEESIKPLDCLQQQDIIGKKTKIALSQNTPLTSAVLIDNIEIEDDIRIQEFSAIFLPKKLSKNDCIDIRINFPNGEDYIVLSKKNVIDIERQENTEQRVDETIWIHLSEEEILRISSAIVDAYINEGTKIYAISYVVPELQEQATVNYPVNEPVYQLILKNPNIVKVAADSLTLNKRKVLEANLQILDEESKPLSYVKTTDSEIPKTESDNATIEGGD